MPGALTRVAVLQRTTVVPLQMLEVRPLSRRSGLVSPHPSMTGWATKHCSTKPQSLVNVDRGPAFVGHDLAGVHLRRYSVRFQFQSGGTRQGRGRTLL